MHTIGAVGGHFAQSKLELLKTSEVLCPDEVVFYPDAGAVNNGDLLLHYFRTFTLLRERRIKTLVARWGQMDKENADDYLRNKLLRGKNITICDDVSIRIELIPRQIKFAGCQRLARVLMR